MPHHVDRAAKTLLEELLEKPVGPTVTVTSAPRQLTAKLEVKGDRIDQEIHLSERDVIASVDPKSVAAEHLRKQGENPDDWEIVTMRSSEWTMFGGELGQSVRFNYRRIRSGGLDLDELLASIDSREPEWSTEEYESSHGFLVLIGDMQFGKIDGDGVEGTVRRIVEYIDKAAQLLWEHRHRFDIEHVHIGWLGDHLEGFVSQGGANVWRTQLTQTEQERLVRRVMLYALQVFAPLCSRLTMVAVPGNHGDTVRFVGKGTTRYDDSHDTEALIAVKDAVDLADRADYKHVEFYVPQTDEMTVAVEVCGTLIAHAHGHKWRPGKHFDWWQGQSFNRDSVLGECDVLVAGHLHHGLIEEDGDRLFIQVPSIESESTWYRHQKGTGGHPGLIVAVTKDGNTSPIEIVR